MSDERRVGGSFEKTNRFLFILGSEGGCEVDVEETVVRKPVGCEQKFFVIFAVDDLKRVTFFCNGGTLLCEWSCNALDKCVGQTSFGRANLHVSRCQQFDGCICKKCRSVCLMLPYSSKQVACAKWGSGYCRQSFLRMMSLKHRVLLYAVTIFYPKKYVESSNVNIPKSHILSTPLASKILLCLNRGTNLYLKAFLFI